MRRAASWARGLLTLGARLLRRIVAPKLGGAGVGGAASPGGHGPSVPALPDWVRDEILAAAAVDPDVLQAGESLEKFTFYALPLSSVAGELYRRVASEIGARRYEYVVFGPWLKRGGADRGTLYHLRVVREYRPEARVLLVTTEDGVSPWLDRVPAGVDVVEFGRIAAGVEFALQVTAAARLLVQLRPRVVHIINSRVAWEAVRQYGLAVSRSCSLYASLFCDDYDSRMMPVGFARTYLRECQQWLKLVFCDNTFYPAAWSRELGIPSRKFLTLPFPYDRPVGREAIRTPAAHPSRVIWAGRFDRQKRPELLYEVAAAAPELAFDVYGESVVGSPDAVIDRLRALPNVTVHGAFARFEDLVDDRHLAYLHTGAWEGVPTIIMDAMAAGLPVCAPAVGGIPDLLPADLLVPDSGGAPTLVSRLRELASSSELRRRCVDAQLEVLVEARRWDQFAQSVARTLDYFGPGDVTRTPLAREVE